uniref:Putative secreted peptide n=1 Tax=Anopheles braziliensis TaxID=58242 RepID=A0A2M3ZU71_9DIPT
MPHFPSSALVCSTSTLTMLEHASANPFEKYLEVVSFSEPFPPSSIGAGTPSSTPCELVFAVALLGLVSLNLPNLIRLLMITSEPGLPFPLPKASG